MFKEMLDYIAGVNTQRYNKGNRDLDESAMKVTRQEDLPMLNFGMVPVDRDEEIRKQVMRALAEHQMKTGMVEDRF